MLALRALRRQSLADRPRSRDLRASPSPPRIDPAPPARHLRLRRPRRDRPVRATPAPQRKPRPSARPSRRLPRDPPDASLDHQYRRLSPRRPPLARPLRSATHRAVSPRVRAPRGSAAPAAHHPNRHHSRRGPLMRWVWVAAGALAALILAVFLYAFFSLNAIIKANQQRLLARVGAALGRPVTVAKIRATLGWGLGVDLENLTVADDPAFSAAPFAVVRKIHARVELLPLLFRAVRLESFRLT